MVISTNAYAIGELNCSNAQGNVRRVEKEIPGINPVTWIVGDKEWLPNQFSEEFYSDSKESLFKKESVTGDNIVTESDETYAIVVKLTINEKDSPLVEYTRWVICNKWQKNDVKD